MFIILRSGLGFLLIIFALAGGVIGGALMAIFSGGTDRIGFVAGLMPGFEMIDFGSRCRAAISPSEYPCWE
jgi:hypothetical protein